MDRIQGIKAFIRVADLGSFSKAARELGVGQPAITKMIAAMESAVIDSPRGKFKLSKAHNPIQDIYLRKVEKGDNVVVGVAAKALADSGAGCKLT